ENGVEHTYADPVLGAHRRANRGNIFRSGSARRACKRVTDRSQQTPLLHLFISAEGDEFCTMALARFEIGVQQFRPLCEVITYGDGGRMFVVRHFRPHLLSDSGRSMMSTQ